ncbi:MAG: hypothetical protein EAX90_00555 [Candidatus Heimdallarchaeota archaeon]|nr:hypothetical protein [Candidatus Heimdallarchaeota archaeon]
MVFSQSNDTIIQHEIFFCPICGKESSLQNDASIQLEKKCIFCKKSIADVWNVNENQMKMSRLCNQCGNNTSVKAIFCFKCGNKISSYSLLHTPPSDKNYNLGGKFSRNFSLLSILSLALFVLGLFPILMAFIHDRFWLVFIGVFPYNFFAILIGILGILFGYLTKETPSGKTGIIINSLYLSGALIYLIYNLWVFFSSPAY